MLSLPGLLTSSRHFLNVSGELTSALRSASAHGSEARQVNPVGFHVLSELGGETLQELGSQIVDQTVVVPQVVVVLRAQHDSRQRIGRIVHLEPALDLVVFVAHAMGPWQAELTEDCSLSADSREPRPRDTAALGVKPRP